MPLFTFTCDACEKTSETLVQSGHQVACPACGSEKVTKAMSHFAAVSAWSGPDPSEGCCIGPEMGAMCQGGMYGMGQN